MTGGTLSDAPGVTSAGNFWIVWEILSIVGKTWDFFLKIARRLNKMVKTVSDIANWKRVLVKQGKEW